MINKFLALIILLIMSPLFFLLSILLLIVQGRPIFYSQIRIGKNYNLFSLLKFRSMIINKEGPQITEEKDKRITFFGKILRRSKIDELPQLINIIKGDLNFVGPRPEVEEYVKKYNFSFLNKIKPGLTDYSSIIFFDEEKLLSKLGGIDNYHKVLEVKLELINYYINTRNNWIDLKIIMFTIIGIFIPSTVRFYLKNSIYKINPLLWTRITEVGL